MEAQQAINEILNNACYNDTDEGKAIFDIELHCVDLEIVAESILGDWLVHSVTPKEAS